MNTIQKITTVLTALAMMVTIASLCVVIVDAELRRVPSCEIEVS